MVWKDIIGYEGIYLISNSGKVKSVKSNLTYTFHYPKKGTLKQWFNFVEGADRLQHGYNKEYLIALQELMLLHKENKNAK